MNILSEDVQVDLGDFLTTTISDDGWEIIGPTHINYWKAAKLLLNQWAFTHDQHELTLEVNWSPVIRRIQQVHKTMQRLEKVKQTPAANLISFPRSNVRIKFNVRRSSRSSKDGPLADSYVEYFLYDLFLLMNICSPASCNLYNATVLSRDKRWRKARSKINLANTPFEVALLDSRNGKWPAIEFLPLEETIRWFSNVRPKVGQLPETRMEKVLFAFLHLCKTDISPMIVIWIFYALETLFDTRAGENFRILITRIELLLCPKENDLRHLKKKLRELYDYRSAIVHGGLNIIHPLNNDFLDKRLEAENIRLMNVTDFGFQVLLSSIQEVIKRGWTEPNFQEELSGSSKF